ncbi:cytidylyltransferase domain-containing protein [Idiomarina sp. ST10R2A5]|uniref:RraA family protein n=1 Tax=Idiomarina sp. ST10R2A5 TaxID=3418368 RepID=UPI003EC85425
MRVVAFLPAKGSSSRIESKNLKLLDGKPLFLHTLEKLVLCDFIDEVYLDTESKDVIDFASEIDCKILNRDPSLASNKTDGNQLFMNEVNQVEADIYIQILGTSPFIQPDTIKKGVDALMEPSSGYDSAVLVNSEKQYTWEEGKPSYDINHIPNSVDLDDTVIETMGLYIVKNEAAKKTNRRVGESPLMLQASPLEAIDVNWPEEFELANLIAAGLREQDRRLLTNIRNHLTSSMLSDILDDFGYSNQVIRGLTPNIPEAKFLGRAKTLKLRKLKKGEDFKGIYSALHSYDTIIPNDIILVENDTPDYAYFGELNANLAIRAGASAVVVGGKTRDSSEVLKLGLPVFSSGYTCQDVRKRATMASLNKTINLSGVSVSPGSLVFGDAEGLVVIPKVIEKEVIEEIYTRASNEKKILVDISMGAEVSSLVKNYGFF